MEIRRLATPPTVDPAKANRLVGYAARFNVPSEILTERGRTFVEFIRPGAFRGVLASGRPILALWQHGQDGRPPLGRSPATLQLAEDAQGLRFSLDLPAAAADVREAVERGDVWGMSFAMRGEVDRWSAGDKWPVREVLEIPDLPEISVVIEPAYPQTSVAARSAVAIPDLATPALDRARRLLALAERA